MPARSRYSSVRSKSSRPTSLGSSELDAAGHELYWGESKHPSPRKMIVRRIADADTQPSAFADGFGYVTAVFATASTVFVADSQPARIVELKR